MAKTALTAADRTTTREDFPAPVKPDPVKIGRAWWRLVPSERPIWAIIMHLIYQGDIEDATKATDALVAQTASDFAITEDEVRAAIAYYAKNQKYIDAVITLNTDDGYPD